MLARTLFSLLNLAAMAVALLAWFVLPQYAVYVLYGFVAWMVVGFVLLGSSWGSRAVGSGARGTVAPGAPEGGPLASGAAPTAGPASAPGFCIYCAADLPVGAERCPACNHAVRTF
ncbi:MAG: hypothetical protein ACLQD9_00205 [Thermoplasmata archaeon]|nr:hypothetical protein [Thermoplasmata archaeon]